LLLIKRDAFRLLCTFWQFRNFVHLVIWIVVVLRLELSAKGFIRVEIGFNIIIFSFCILSDTADRILWCVVESKPLFIDFIL
jgi:hypothetical protein